jgi:hypothetical protein
MYTIDVYSVRVLSRATLITMLAIVRIMCGSTNIIEDDGVRLLVPSAAESKYYVPSKLKGSQLTAVLFVRAAIRAGKAN